MSCYAGQFGKYEGLTVNFSEAVSSAGGRLLDASGKPQVTSEAAKQAARFLADGFGSGMIPKEAITYKEEEKRVAFQEGKLLSYRNWAYGYEAAAGKDAYAFLQSVLSSGHPDSAGMEELRTLVAEPLRARRGHPLRLLPTTPPGARGRRKGGGRKRAH
ncbi:hypothetical protein [Nonomuraea diastatica]|uniref:Extracellular solute-binding protein n=1 Tax=Nonomuraea diastatica TaxID=1848329 RepID=A0A4R4WQI0_9ACTN|nr:hypothetical protein [Nonomuraea diastatica]TDD17010.1 hypothetical protein E1294_29275 [Nonomuraea diastatica]